MIINDELITELEGLAKLRLTGEEREKVKTELDDVLGYMQILNELDTDGVEAKSHAFDTACELREDVCKKSLTADEICENAPQKQEGFFAVPKAFE